MTKTESAETVRRFLAKAYPPEHAVFAALDRLATCGCKVPAVLHGDFGAMELTRKQDHESCSHWGLVYSD